MPACSADIQQRPAIDHLYAAGLQGLVMMAQNRYQRRRMYTRIAMGKNRAMDVVSGESSGSSGQLFIIYPMLLGLQISQFAIGEQPMLNWHQPIMDAVLHDSAVSPISAIMVISNL